MVLRQQISRFFNPSFSNEVSEDKVCIISLNEWLGVKIKKFKPYLGDSGKHHENMCCPSGAAPWSNVGIRQLQSPDILRVPKVIQAAAIDPTNW
jgi:hypothetical protein